MAGSGRQPLQRDKTQTEGYYLLTPAAIAKELEHRGVREHTASVHLAAGLPLTRFCRDKKSFRSYLYRDGSAIPFRYEGQDHTAVTIQEVSLVSPGLCCRTDPDGTVGRAVRHCGGHWRLDGDLMRLDNPHPQRRFPPEPGTGMIRCIDEISEQVRRLFGLSMTTAQIEHSVGCVPAGWTSGSERSSTPRRASTPETCSRQSQRERLTPSHARHFLLGGGAVLNATRPQTACAARLPLDDVSLNAGQ